NVERPNLAGNPNNGPKVPAEWFNTAAFAVPAPYSLGNSGRNVVTGPGLANVDLSLQKQWPLRESQFVEMRVDAFNALNHPNFNLPGRILGAANFGVITSAQDARELQFALKFVF
ncbi:MAG TPA: carboxypeptidase regulatory-like domain-containing protein, partial [Candidatus Sulfopaludibacter sp.]|nr:carboxypeptidase regulatory-like domain-containing protein [Candidatus Sulfopaludibacter sp.]